MVTTTEKQRITQKVSKHIERYDSQNAAANALKGISAATLSQVMNEKWEMISEEMWRKIDAQTGTAESQWQTVETRDFKLINHFLSDAQQNSNVFAIIGDAGTGKSYTLKHYAATHKRAYLLCCNEFWNRKYFLAELLSIMGRDSGGLTVAEMMQEVVRTLQKQDCPLIIMDESDKLTDQVLYFFITLYNTLEEQCGLVLCATDHLAKRLQRGLKLNKKGYKEIYSRIGRKPIELHGVGYTDVVQVCVANGIDNKATIKEIYNDCEEDLRRVKRKIHAVKLRGN